MRMKSSNMVTFLAPAPAVIENSVFGVWKEVDKSQRLIWGGNCSNQLFNPLASSVELPTPDLLSELSLAEGEHLFLAGCDISQYYNRLRPPAFLVPFFGLPRIRSTLVQAGIDSEYVVPCLLCIPMGATFAVQLSQAASLALVRRAGLGNRRVDSASDRTLCGGFGSQLTYIDDCNSVGTSLTGVNEATRRIIHTLEHHGLPTAEKKLQWAQEDTTAAALGLWWWPDGVLTVKPEMASRLKAMTEALLARGYATAPDMRHVLGCWTWACLLRRGLLSVLEAVYELATADEKAPARHLSPVQRR